MIIHVTKDHIVECKRFSTMGCPVATAIVQMDADTVRAEVDSTQIYLDTKNSRYRFETTDDLKNWILDFDAGEHVDPIFVEINDWTQTAYIIAHLPETTGQNPYARHGCADDYDPNA